MIHNYPRSSRIYADGNSRTGRYLQEMAQTVSADMRKLEDEFRDLRRSNTEPEDLMQDVASYWREVEKGLYIVKKEIDYFSDSHENSDHPDDRCGTLSPKFLSACQEAEFIEDRLDNFLEDVDDYEQVKEYRQELAENEENPWESLEE